MLKSYKEKKMQTSYLQAQIYYYNIQLKPMHPKYSAMFTSINMLLGAGPLILPAPYFSAGIALSTIWMVIIVGISYMSALFIAEAMSKIYFIQFESSQKSLLESEVNSDIQDVARSSIAEEKTTAQIQGKDQSDQQGKSEVQAIDHNQQMEIVFGKKYGEFAKIATSIALIIYVAGTAVSKCIMTSKTLSKVFEGVQYVQKLQLWLGVFFVCGAIFSFRSIEKTAALQFIIIIVRFLSIFFMLGGAIYIMIDRGVQTLIPKEGGVFNFSSFTQIFSNSLFCLMFHHSFPSIAASIKSSNDVSFVLRNAFIIAGSILIVVPVTGIMAFGEELSSKSSTDLKYYNFDFQNYIPFIYYFVSFYVFLNIAVLPVYVIVIRSNILKMINPRIDSKVFSKTTLFSTLVILIVVLLISYLAQDFIQIVLDFTGGIFGVVILFIIPALQVYMAREITHKKWHRRNYIRWLPLLIIILGVGFMGFNLWNVVKQL